MSWSVAAIGRAGAVVISLEKQFAKGVCAEPEESVRQATAAALIAAVKAQDQAIVVRVIASGSQGYKDWNTKTGVYNELNVTVEPLHGYVE